MMHGRSSRVAATKAPPYIGFQVSPRSPPKGLTCPPVSPSTRLLTGRARWACPEYDKVEDGDFARIFDQALTAHAKEVEAIAGNAEAPTIDNTLAALELSGDALDQISSIFWNRSGAHTNDTIQAVERDISPKMARHFSAISMNARLFARIDDLYQRRDQLALDPETLRVLEKTWKNFVRAGAKLDAKGKKRLGAINEELASLGAAFGQNVLADEKEWALFLDEADLAGVPDFLKSSMAEAAELRGEKGRFAVTLSRSIYEPFMSFSERRDLREQAYRGFTMRGQMGGKSDWRDGEEDAEVAG